MTMKNTQAVQTAKPKKKRIRRQKLELEYLRGLVGKLEIELTQLKSNASHEVLKRAPSTWKPIAERQVNERTRVEEKNLKLRALLQDQLKVTMRLYGILRKCLRKEDVLKEVKQIKATFGQTDDAVFAEQLAHVERAHLEAAAFFAGPEFADKASTFDDMHVVADACSDTGVAFVTRSNCLLPFDPQVTERGFWRAFAKEGISKTRYFYDQRLATETLVANSYGLLFRAGGFYGNVSGRQTYRRYAADNYVLIMWKSVVEPKEINGNNFSGLRCHQTGWIKLGGVKLASKEDADSMTSTTLQVYSKTTLELRDNSADQELQIRALTDFVLRSHETIAKVYGGMINDLLVEEDWNLNGWAS